MVKSAVDRIEPKSSDDCSVSGAKVPGSNTVNELSDSQTIRGIVVFAA